MSMISRMVEVFRLQPEAERNVLVFTHTHTHIRMYINIKGLGFRES